MDLFVNQTAITFIFIFYAHSVNDSVIHFDITSIKRLLSRHAIGGERVLLKMKAASDVLFLHCREDKKKRYAFFSFAFQVHAGTQ